MFKTSLWNFCTTLGTDLGKGQFKNTNLGVQVVQLEQPVFLVTDLEQQYLTSETPIVVWLQREAAAATEVGPQQATEGLPQEGVDAAEVVA